MKKTLLATAALMTAIGGQALAADYKVGVLLPYSGTYAVLGKEIEAGFNLALEHFGGELSGDTITYVKEDTEMKPPVGLAKAKKLVLQDKADVLVGIVSSGVLGAVRDLVHGAKVPLVVANAGNDQATGEKCSPYVIRVSFSNAQINAPMGPWLADKGVKTVYTLAPDYAAGHQMMDTFKKTFEGAGGKIVGQVYTPFGKTKDFGPYLTEAKNANPDAIYVFYAGGEAINFVKQYADFGIKDSVPLYSPGWLTSPLYVHVQGPAADKITTILNYTPTIDNAENKRFVEDFGAKNKDKGGNARVPSEFAVQGYDAGRLVIEAAKAAGGDKAKFKAGLSKVKFNGPRGPLEIDPKTNNIVQNMYIYTTMVNDGKATQDIKDVIEGVRDEPKGCQM